MRVNGCNRPARRQGCGFNHLARRRETCPVKNSETLTGFLNSPDDFHVRIVSLILMAASAMAESHPSWWTLVAPNATAIVGIDWQSLKNSPFAGAVRAGLPEFPNLPLLGEARQVLISSPEMLAIVSGNFSTETLHQQAAEKGLKAATY